MILFFKFDNFIVFKNEVCLTKILFFRIEQSRQLLYGLGADDIAAIFSTNRRKKARVHRLSFSQVNISH